MKFSSKYSVPSRIDISVGVGEGGMDVGGAGVSVAGRDIGKASDGTGVKVGRISALKLQAASSSELTIRKVTDSKNLWCFIQTHFC